MQVFRGDVILHPSDDGGDDLTHIPDLFDLFRVLEIAGFVEDLIAQTADDFELGQFCLQLLDGLPGCVEFDPAAESDASGGHPGIAQRGQQRVGALGAIPVPADLQIIVAYAFQRRHSRGIPFHNAVK